MTTATPTRPLADVFRERWQQDPHRASEGNSADIRNDAASLVKNLMVGDYWQWEEGSMDDPLAPVWLEALRGAAEQASRRAFDEYVVPEIARAIVLYLRQNPPPAHLVAFEGSEQLRGDLAILEAGR